MKTISTRKIFDIRTAQGAGALILLGLALSGCSMGNPGYQQYSAGDYETSHQSFVADYNNHPDDAIAQFNMGGSDLQRGNTEQANVYFHQAAKSGKGVIPDGMTEPHNSHTTIADAACRHLHEAQQSDTNCSADGFASAD